MAPNRSSHRRPLTSLLFVSICVSFTYGVAVGVYKLFPFEYLYMAKAVITGVLNSAETAQAGGKINQNYLNRIAVYDLYEATSDVVMIGDSITDIAEWSEFFPAVSIANRGIGGDTTEGVLNRLDSVYLTGAKTVFLLVGINDIGRGDSVDTVYSNYEKIIEDLLSHGVQPFIQSTILAGDVKKAFNPRVNELNNRLGKLAASKNILFINLNTHLAKGGILNAEFTTDGIHLNAAGYRVWKRAIEPILMQASASAENTGIIINTP